MRLSDRLRTDRGKKADILHVFLRLGARAVVGANRLPQIAARQYELTIELHRAFLDTGFKIVPLPLLEEGPVCQYMLQVVLKQAVTLVDPFLRSPALKGTCLIR